MATTIRLTRMGRKKRPFYRMVVVDSRDRRDGDYIESLGTYNPVPAAYELSLDSDRAVHWLEKGAVLSSTARSLLKREGVLYRWHLQKSGTDAAKIDEMVEEFRARHQARDEKTVAEARAQEEKQRQAKEEAARKAKEEAEKAEAAAKEAAVAEAAAESAEADEKAEGAGEEKAEAAPAEDAPAEKADEESSDEPEGDEEKK